MDVDELDVFDDEFDFGELSEEEKKSVFEVLRNNLVNKNEELGNLKNELEEKEEKISELENLAKKIKADFENYKKRVNEKLEKRYVEGKEELVNELLDVVDSFDQALDFSGEVNEDFLEGVENIRELLLDKLRDEGLREVSYDGFDPCKHQAIAKVDVDEGKDNDEIVEVVQRGYVFDGKIIRPALVKVKE